MSETTSTLPEALTAFHLSMQRQMHTCCLATVETFDPATNKISAKPIQSRGYVDGTGTRQVEDIPVINSIPVAMLGSGGYGIDLPIAQGDTVLLVFSHCSIDQWKANGVAGDTQDDRLHHIADAIAIPGVRSFQDPNLPGNADATKRIKFTPTTIEVGGGKALVTQEQFLNHTHLTAGTGAPVAPTALSPSPALTGTAVTRGS